MSLTIKVFVVDGALQYISHDGDHPNDDAPAMHVRLKPAAKVRWKSFNGDIQVHFEPGSNGDISPFVSANTDVPDPTKAPKATTSYETIRRGGPNPDGTNPTFKYSVTVGAITDDPDIIMDLGGGGGPMNRAPVKKKAVKKAPPKKAAKKYKR